MPIATFWELARNIDRLRAEEDIRMANLLGSLFSKDSTEYFDGLKQSIGSIAEAEESFDRNGFERLRIMIGG